MFPKWLHGATVSESGRKWFTLRSPGVCTRGPQVVVLRNVRVSTFYPEFQIELPVEVSNLGIKEMEQ